MILTSWEEKGIKKGLQRGRREGKLEGIYSTATNLKKSGVDISVIVHCTGLSEEEIKKI